MSALPIDEIQVSIVIPVFNNISGLMNCVSLLEKQSGVIGKFEVIVVDNASAVPIILPNSKLENLKIINCQTPGSYAARNAGIRVATGRLIAFVDSDCSPNSDWLRNGLAQFAKDPTLGILAGEVEVEVQNHESPSAYELFDMHFYLRQDFYIKKYHFGATANLWTRRSLFETYGVFREDMMSGGDQEWGFRCFQAGVKQAYSKSVLVKHQALRSTPDILRRARRLAGGNLKLRKNRSSIKSLWFINFAWDCVRVLVDLVRAIKVCFQRKYFKQLFSFSALVFRVRLQTALEQIPLAFGKKAERV